MLMNSFHTDVLIYTSGWRSKHCTYTWHTDSPSYSVWYPIYFLWKSWQN